MKIRHKHQSTLPNNPNKDVSSARWNDDHADESGNPIDVPVSANDIEALRNAANQGVTFFVTGPKITASDPPSPGPTTQARVAWLTSLGIPQDNILWNVVGEESAGGGGTFAIDGITVTPVIGNITLTPGGNTFTVDGISVTPVLDNIVMVQAGGTLAVDGLTVTPTIDNITLTQPANYDQSGFETDMNGWTNAGSGGATFGRITTQAHTGAYSLHGGICDTQVAKITKTLNTATGIMTVWVYVEQGALDYFGPGIYTIHIHAGGATSTFQPSSGGWQMLSHSFIGAPGDVVYIELVNGPACVDGSINLGIDDISIPIP